MQECHPNPKIMLGSSQFRCAFRESFSRRSESGIQCERLLEDSNRALVLIEQREIASSVDEHGCVCGQHLELNHVVVLKLQRPISQTAGLQLSLWRILKS